MADNVYHTSHRTRSEPTASLSRPANLFKLLVVILAFAAFIAVYQWANRGHASGFVFTRLGFLEANVQTGGRLLERYGSFPFAAAFLAVLRTSLRTTSVTAAFLPVIPVVAVLFIYPFARLFFENKIVAVVATVPTYLSVFALTPHFAEYLFGRLFFLLFVFSTVLFLNEDARYRQRFGALAIGFYLGVKFFAPPMEVWAISWMGLLLLLMAVRYHSASPEPFGDGGTVGRVRISRSVLKRAAQFTLLLVVLLFAYNPKLYDQLLVTFQLRPGNIATALEALASKITGSSAGPSSEFTALSQSPRLLQLANILKFGLMGAVIVAVIAKRTVRSGIGWVYESFREVLAIALLGAYGAEFFLYAAVGAGIQIRYVILVFPIIAIFYAANTKPRSLLALVVAGLLVTSAFGVTYELTQEPSREFAGSEATEELVHWEHTYATSDRTTTDHHTLGLLMAVSGAEYQDPQPIDLVQLDSGMYASFTDSADGDGYEFDYLVLNRATASEPAMRGPPSWTVYEPLGRYTDGMDGDRNLRKVYASDRYVVYRSV